MTQLTNEQKTQQAEQENLLREVIRDLIAKTDSASASTLPMTRSLFYLQTIRSLIARIDGAERATERRKRLGFLQLARDALERLIDYELGRSR